MTRASKHSTKLSRTLGTRKIIYRKDLKPYEIRTNPTEPTKKTPYLFNTKQTNPICGVFAMGCGAFRAGAKEPQPAVPEAGYFQQVLMRLGAHKLFLRGL